LVGLVELRIIFARLAVIIDDVAQMIEKGRLAAFRVARSVGFHRLGHDLLRPWISHPAGVTANVKHHLLVEAIRQSADEVLKPRAVRRCTGTKGKVLIRPARMRWSLREAGRISLRAMPPSAGGLMMPRAVPCCHGRSLPFA
jgi:hypothetical protein